MRVQDGNSCRDLPWATLGSIDIPQDGKVQTSQCHSLSPATPPTTLSTADTYGNISTKISVSFTPPIEMDRGTSTVLPV
jgi:hypothetical protein